MMLPVPPSTLSHIHTFLVAGWQEGQQACHNILIQPSLIVVFETCVSLKNDTKLEAKDLLPNQPHATTERAKKCRFLTLVTLTFKLVQRRDQTCLLCEFGTNPFSGSRDISYTKKNTDRRRQQHNLPQFTVHSSLREVNSDVCMLLALEPLLPARQTPWIHVCTHTNKQILDLSFGLFMATLCNSAGHYNFVLQFLSSSFLSFFSSSNLSGRSRLDVYHTSTHGVALM